MTVDELSLSVMEPAARLAAIVESSDDAIISKNLSGYVITWNRAAERIFGYTAAEAVGRHITFIIPPDLRSQEDEILARLRAGERIDHFETVRQRKDGTLVDVSITVSPVRNERGDIVGASKIVRDISDAKRQAETKELLLSEIKHRVKNMLSIIDAIAVQTLRDAPGSMSENFGARIRALAAAHDALTAQDWKGSELSVLLREALAPFHGRHSGQLSVQGPAVMLNANTSLLLGLVFHELATNAIKYGAWSTAAGRVDVRWSQDAEGNIALVWSETGGPAVVTPVKTGFGSTLITRALKQSGGTGVLTFPEAGAVCRLTLLSRTLVF